MLMYVYIAGVKFRLKPNTRSRTCNSNETNTCINNVIKTLLSMGRSHPLGAPLICSFFSFRRADIREVKILVNKMYTVENSNLARARTNMEI